MGPKKCQTPTLSFKGAYTPHEVINKTFQQKVRRLKSGEKIQNLEAKKSRNFFDT